MGVRAYEDVTVWIAEVGDGELEIDPEAQAALERELNEGEILFWTGRPPRGFWSSGDILSWEIFSWAFGLMFALFVAGMSRMQMRDLESAQSFWVPLALFVCFAALLSLGPRFWDQAVRKRTFYGISDNRILVLTGIRGTVRKSVSLKQLVEVALCERDDGTGTIDFAKYHGDGRFKEHEAYPPGLRKWPAFDRIRDAREVFAHLDQVIKKARQL